jgi:hypothetical protein
MEGLEGEGLKRERLERAGVKEFVSAYITKKHVDFTVASLN